MAWMCDFETTKTIPTRVWLWSACDIDDTGNIAYGTSIESFMEFAVDKPQLYFHNLAFDGVFIVSYMLRNGMKFDANGSYGSFKTLISQQNIWYSITIPTQFCTVTIKDSLKKLPMSVKRIAKSFKLPLSKGSIDHNKNRPEGYEPTKEEIDYVTNDVKIPALALKQQFEKNLVKLTIGADALTQYRKIIGKRRFDYFFPKINKEIDGEIRRSYKGGFTFLKPEYMGKEINRPITVYDVNSLYPYVMYCKPMPCGEPIFFEGEYEFDEIHPLYVIRFKADFTLRKNHLPTITSSKPSPFHVCTDYISESVGMEELTLTSVDYELFRKHYIVHDIEFLGGYKFEETTNMFKEYVDYWSSVKADSEGGLREIAKLMLNSLYGKFAKNPDVTTKHPILDENGVVKLVKDDQEISEGLYIPVGTFITAWARYVTITCGQINYHNAVYFDTDSIHVIGNSIEGIEVHDKKLGAWKIENEAVRGKYLRPKRYMLDKGEGELYLRCAGLPDSSREKELEDGSTVVKIKWDDFHKGAKFNKLAKKNVEGGVILNETLFELR